MREAQRERAQRGERCGERYRRTGDQLLGPARRHRHLLGEVGQPTDHVIDRHEIEARARAGGQDTMRPAATRRTRA